MSHQLEDLVSRLAPVNEESRPAFAYLFSDASRAAATLNVLNDANYLDIALNSRVEYLPPFISEGLCAADLEKIRSISYDPDEFEFLLEFYEELYPDHGDPLSQAKQDFYDELVLDAAAGIQDELMSDREASYVVMERALTLSHRFDKDQQTVADDIIASFTYSYGMSPEDYADSMRNRHNI